jgi:hypothetical protein
MVDFLKVGFVAMKWFAMWKLQGRKRFHEVSPSM